MKASATSSTATAPAGDGASPSRPVDRFRLTGPTRARDPRITAARRDIADMALAGELFAPHYARAQRCGCGPSAFFVRGEPAATAPAVTQLLPGEDFSVLDIGGDWAWGQVAADGYVGYVPVAALGPSVVATHVVTALLAPVFARADIKSPVTVTLPVGSRIDAVADGPFLAVAGGGFVHARHAVPVDTPLPDPVETACRLVGMPYVWGARGGGGIDCSGLVQLSLALSGIPAPRDSDQQRGAVGHPLPDDAALRRGDLVFLPGHVGMMVDSVMLVHANAHAMAVTVEPLADVVARAGPGPQSPILARRRPA